MDKAPSSAAKATRNAAGDGMRAAVLPRHRHAKASWPAAATCRRRKTLASSPSPGQARMPAKPPQASNCSTLQGRSLPARTITNRSSTTPAAAQAGACTCQGGATRANQPPASDRRAKAGSSKLISPMPLRSTSNSVRVPRGQPPPGNSASSSRQPLEMVASGREASVSPRQTSPLASTSAKATGNGTALMTAWSRLRVSTRQQCPRWRIPLRRGER